MPIHKLAHVVRDTVVLVGGVLLILGMGMAITNFLIDQEVPQLILDWVGARIHKPVVFLIALNLFLLGVGCIMDIYTATVVIVPLLLAGWGGYHMPGSGDSSVQSDLLFGALTGFGIVWPPAISTLTGVRAFIQLAREGG